MKDGGVRVRNTGVFKLKDKPNRQFQVFHLEKQFGFVPEIIIIEKIYGQSNKLVLRAVLTEEEIKKEDKKFKEKKKGGKEDVKKPIAK